MIIHKCLFLLIALICYIFVPNLHADENYLCILGDPPTKQDEKLRKERERIDKIIKEERERQEKIRDEEREKERIRMEQEKKKRNQGA